MRKKELWALNWLRFGLAVYLVLFHTLNKQYVEINSHKYLSYFLDIGNMATTIFFVLSGFLLTYVYVLDKKDHELDGRKFLLARFSALYPLHIFTFLLSIPVTCVAIYLHGAVLVPVQPLSTVLRPLSHWEVISNVVMNLTLLQAWNPLYSLFNSPSWSISVLLFFYILFPYFAPRLNRVRHPFLALLVLGCVFALPGAVAQIFQLSGLVVEGVLHKNPLVRLPLFLAGIVLAVIYSRHSNNASSDDGVKLKTVLCIVILVTIILASYIKGEHQDVKIYLIDNGSYFFAALAIVWLLANVRGTATGWNAKLSARLGKTALPIFALHVPLADIFLKFEKFGIIVFKYMNSNAGMSQLIADAHNFERLIILYPIYFFIVIYSSILLQEKFVEPMQKYVKNKFNATLAVRSLPAEELGLLAATK